MGHLEGHAQVILLKDVRSIELGECVRITGFIKKNYRDVGFVELADEDHSVFIDCRKLPEESMLEFHQVQIVGEVQSPPTGILPAISSSVSSAMVVASYIRYVDEVDMPAYRNGVYLRKRFVEYLQVDAT
ncbi:hypothetical protein IE077_003695 [Cardiosporidium cionae]|uniref:Uncharacterized protein n=1 Tax=Cardiosporidium cionae TaxID=476202 RepID=A0ABQ7JEN3_9APIC|nr:hypothetical protein IE077_003695 [Cardiosporidium cionae]|eukprot:KAF8822472.1 hypothetical protein IE077_003695 [Cardiosporidium cionae]